MPVTHQATTEAVKTAAQSLSVIGYLEFRDKTITILAGPEGPRYSVSTKSGGVLAHQLNEKELQAQFPSLYQTLKTGTAGNDARRN